MRKNLLKVMWTIAVWTTVACGGKSFNVASESNSFLQSNTVKAKPIDILWVVDNSGSMATSQQMLANNVSSFINGFVQTNFDFRMAVVTTDAYKGMLPYGSDPSMAYFRDGARDYYPNDGINDATHSGYFVIDRNTPNLSSVYQVNVLQGILGGGDERGFQSMEAALLSPNNIAMNFPRPEAMLVVILMTDEEDFSWDGTANIQQIVDPVTGQTVNNTEADPRLHPISRYLSILDTVTNSTATTKNYMVSSIAIFDDACRQQLTDTTFTGRRIAQRYAQLTDATGGVKASLCDNFNNIMSNLSDSILEFSHKFYLNRTPIIDTLKIYVNGNLVPSTGYTYNPTDNSVTFQAQFIPPEDAAIRVEFTPASLK